MPEIYDTPIIQNAIQTLKEREAKVEYIDGLVSRMSEFKVSGRPLTGEELIGGDLHHGAELFNLQDFSPKVQTDILLSLAYFRSPAFQERVEMSLGYAPGSEMTAQDVETYNKVVERAEEAYNDITFEVESDIAKSHHMITFDGKSIVRIPDGNDQHELDSKLYSSLGVTTHEIAHYIYNSAASDSINPGTHHQGEGESLTPSESYGKDNSPYNRINESNPTREQVAEWYKQKDPQQYNAMVNAEKALAADKKLRDVAQTPWQRNGTPTNSIGNQGAAAWQGKFKQYPDEPLNPRISKVTPFVDENTVYLNMTVDGKEKNLTVSNRNTVDAFNAGALPLNVLANKVLEMTDRLQVNLQNRFEMTLEEQRGQEMAQSQGFHR